MRFLANIVENIVYFYFRPDPYLAPRLHSAQGKGVDVLLHDVHPGKFRIEYEAALRVDFGGHSSALPEFRLRVAKPRSGASTGQLEALKQLAKFQNGMELIREALEKQQRLESWDIKG